MRQRRLLALGLALALSLLASLYSAIALQPPVALAHAYVTGSDPVDGSTIATPPSRVRIFFNAPISAVSSAHVYYIQQETLLEENAAHSSVSPTNPRELVTILKPARLLPAGSYEVKWTAVSNDDGHTTYGLIGFNIGYASNGLAGTPTLGPTTSNDLDGIHTLNFINILSIIWEWLVLVALIFWIGILVTERLILPSTQQRSDLLERAHKHALALQWLCLSVLLFGECVELILRVARLSQILNEGGFDFPLLAQLITETNYGLYWLLRLALLGMALFFLSWTTRSQPPLPLPAQSKKTLPHSGPLRSTNTQELRLAGAQHQGKERGERGKTFAPLLSHNDTPIWFTLAGLIVFTRALSGASAQIAHPHISAVVFEWLLVIAQGIWFGGFAYLGYVLMPLLPVLEKDHHAEILATLQRTFTPFLLGSIGVVLLSSLFLQEASIDQAQHWFSDPYGRTLLAQTGIVALMTLLSLYGMLVLRPKLTRQVLLLPVVKADLPGRRARQSAIEQTERGLKQVVGIQAWLGIAVLLCTALMAFYAPPIVFPAGSYSNPTQSASTQQIQTQQIGPLTSTLQLSPGRVAYPNTVILTLNQQDGKPVTDAEVELRINMQAMDMGTTHVTLHAGNPIYSTTFNARTTFSMPGLWVIHVQVQRPGQPLLQTDVHVMLK